VVSSTKAAHVREVDELKRQLLKSQSDSQRALQAELSTATANVTRLSKDLTTITQRSDKLTRDNTLLSNQLESETKRAHDMASLVSFH
jgi:Trp operon repressor